MNLKNKKGQVSIEVLAILTIVILGATIAGVYYLNSVNKHVDQGDLSQDSFDDAFNDINGSGYGTGSNPSTPTKYFAGIDKIDTNPGYTKDQQVSIRFDANTNFAENYVHKVALYKDTGMGPFVPVDNTNYTMTQGSFEADLNYSTFNNAGKLDNHQGVNIYSTSLNFKFLEEGTYKIYAVARNDDGVNPGNFTVKKSDPFDVVTTSTPSATILNPVSGSIYAEGDSIDLNSLLENRPANTDCRWSYRLDQPVDPTAPGYFKEKEDPNKWFFAMSFGDPIGVEDFNYVSSDCNKFYGDINDFLGPANDDAGTYTIRLDLLNSAGEVLAFDKVNNIHYYKDIDTNIVDPENGDMITSADPQIDLDSNIEGGTGSYNCQWQMQKGIHQPYQEISNTCAENNVNLEDFSLDYGLYTLTLQVIDENIDYLQAYDSITLYYQDDSESSLYFTPSSGVYPTDNFNSVILTNEDLSVATFNFSANCLSGDCSSGSNCNFDTTPVTDISGLLHKYIFQGNNCDPSGIYNIEVDISGVPGVGPLDNNYTILEDVLLSVNITNPPDNTQVNIGNTFNLEYTVDGFDSTTECTLSVYDTLSGGLVIEDQIVSCTASPLNIGVPPSLGFYTYEISAHRGTDNAYASDDVDIEVVAGYSDLDVQITSPNDNDEFTIGDNISFTKSVSNGTSPYTCEWWSGTELIASICSDVNVLAGDSGLEAGDHTITLDITDNYEQSGSDSVDITINSNIPSFDINLPNPPVVRFANYVLPLVGTDTNGDALGTGCEWRIDGDNITSLTKTPGECETHVDLNNLVTNNKIMPSNKDYNLSLIYNGETVSKTIYIGECLFSDTNKDTACVYGGVCNDDPSFEYLGKCSWLTADESVSFDDVVDFNIHSSVWGKDFLGPLINKVGHASVTGSYNREEIDGWPAINNKYFYSFVPRTVSSDNTKNRLVYAVQDGNIRNMIPLEDFYNLGTQNLVTGSFSVTNLYFDNNDFYNTYHYNMTTPLVSYVTLSPDWDSIRINTSYDSMVFGFPGSWSGDSSIPDIVCSEPGHGTLCQAPYLVANGIASGFDSDTNMNHVYNLLYTQPEYDPGDEFGRYLELFKFDLDTNLDSSFDDWQEIEIDTDYDDGLGHPSIAADGNKLVVLVPNYGYYDDSEGSPSFKLYYSEDAGETWINNGMEIESSLFPIQDKGNTLIFDSQGKLHFSGGFAHYNSPYHTAHYTKQSLITPSTPMEMIFDFNSEGLKSVQYNTVYPLPGINDLPYGGLNGTIVSSESLVPNLAFNNNYCEGEGAQLDMYLASNTTLDSLYQEQAINKEKDWMIQMWLSYSGFDDGEDPYPSARQSLKVSLSKDNGKHWTFPIVLGTVEGDGYTTTTGIYNTVQHPISYPHISNKILVNPNNSNIGGVFIYFSELYPASWSSQPNYKGRFAKLEFDFSKLDYTNSENYFNKLDKIQDFEQEFSIVSGNIGVSRDNVLNIQELEPYRMHIFNDNLDRDVYYYDPDYCASYTLLDGEKPELIGKNNFNSDTGEGCYIGIEPSLRINFPVDIGLKDVFRYNADNKGDIVPNWMGEDPSSYGGGAGYSTGNTCFKEGTYVYTPKGKIPIEKIKKGDLVYTYNSSEKSLDTVKVVKPLIHHEKSFLPTVILSLSNGKEITVTLNHSFYDPISKKYKQLHEFNIGDFILYYDLDKEKFIPVIIKNKVIIKDLQTSYNLELGEPHNYLAEGVVVHNATKQPGSGGTGQGWIPSGSPNFGGGGGWNADFGSWASIDPMSYICGWVTINWYHCGWE